jgi:Skp family chaperone for outer membrane proteins
MSANANNPYNKGFIISYKELDTSLQRNKVIYNKSEDDITHQVIPGDRLDALAYNT